MSYFDLSGRSVLIVDDVQATRLIVRSLLTPLNPASMFEASDGNEALRLLAMRRFDLLITDLNMSPMSGVALTKELRRPNNSHNARLPVLMISGHREDAQIRAAIAAGVNEFLLKPLALADFHVRIERMMSKPRRQVGSVGYQGPDRRRRAMWVRHDRRSPPSEI